jgi:hypothetical protein
MQGRISTHYEDQAMHRHTRFVRAITAILASEMNAPGSDVGVGDLFNNHHFAVRL